MLIAYYSFLVVLNSPECSLCIEPKALYFGLALLLLLLLIESSIIESGLGLFNV